MASMRPASVRPDVGGASNTLVVVRAMFNVNAKDVLRVVARARTIDGDVMVRTITRDTMDNIQFPVPPGILYNTDYFVPIHDDLFPEVNHG